MMGFEDPTATLADELAETSGGTSDQGTVEALYRIWSRDYDANQENFRQLQESLNFFAGDQWDSHFRSLRERQSRPSMTFNRMLSLVSNVINDSERQMPTIKVSPTHHRWGREAEIRQGVLRSCLREGFARHAISVAHKHQVVGGDGSFGLHPVPGSRGSRLVVVSRDDPLSVVWDRNSTEPTGADARHCFVAGRLDRARAMALRPDQQFSYDDTLATSFTSSTQEAWESYTRDRIDDGMVSIMTFYEMCERPYTIFHGDDGDPVYKTLDMKLAVRYLHATGNTRYSVETLPAVRVLTFHRTAILEGPHYLPLSRLPEFRLSGWVVQTGGFRKRFGIVDPLRDPQILLNFSTTAACERISASPQAKFLAQQDSVADYEDSYRNAHLSTDPLLLYKTTPPTPVPPSTIELGMSQIRAEMGAEMHEISGIHPAALGAPGNEVSGKAIERRTEGTQVGTWTYEARFKDALLQFGRAANELLPYIYAPGEAIDILAEDKQPVSYQTWDRNFFNDRYEFEIGTGPDYQTRQAERSTSLKQMLTTMPEMMAGVADYVVEAQDWPDKEKIIARLRKTMDPDIVKIEEFPEHEREQEMQRRQRMMQQKEREAEIQEAAARADIEEKQARAEEARARALKARVEAEKARYEMAETAARAESLLQDSDTRRVDVLQKGLTSRAKGD